MAENKCGLLVSLPVNLLCGALGGNLTLKEFARLDSALCHRSSRQNWIALLSAPQFTCFSSLKVSDEIILKWCLSKNFKCSKLEFISDKRKGSLVSEYLRQGGRFAREVHFSGGDKTYDMLLVALYCNNITTLQISDVSVASSLRDLLWSNPSIQDISFNAIACSDGSVLDKLSLQQLEVLRITNTKCSDGFLKRLTVECNSLHTLVLDASRSCDVLDAVQNCPQLRSFSSSRTGIKNEELERFSLSIPKLYNLSLGSYSALADTSVMHVAKNITSLRSLNIRECAALTDHCLVYIANYAGDRLEVLYVDIKTPASDKTEVILDNFGKKCTKLTYLNINCGETPLCAGKGTGLLVRGCPQLRTLVVNKPSTIGASSRVLIEMIRPELQILEHSVSTSYDILTMRM